jgi:hypothetical protein
MKVYIYCFFMGFVLIMLGCNKQEVLNGNDYVHYVENENNALMNKKEIQGLNFQLQYCTTEYLLLKEYKTDHIAEKVIEERKKQNDSLVFFKLRISAKGESDVMNYNIHATDDYYARVQYLSYGFEENIALLNGNDTIFPAVFHFERTYGVAPFADFIMAFNTYIKEDDQFQVLIDDKAFDTGILKFTYNNKDIHSIPKLKTN